MKSKTSAVSAFGAAAAMLVLILDAKTALDGAQNGIGLCIRTVIPSLFPFLVLSVLLTGNLTGSNIAVFRPLGKLLRIPPGGESILVTGLLGGYPIGAQCISQAYKAEKISKGTAHRLLGFCSNAGPAFLFGMLSPLFSSSGAVWTLWGIHSISALLTGMLLPGGTENEVLSAKDAAISFPDALQRGLRTMASICGWVVVFRILIGFCDRWFLWLLPDIARTVFIGVLELTNGCSVLSDIPVEGVRFVLCALFLGLGGICVGMQTVSVTGALGTGLYFPGKLMQAGMSLMLASAAQTLLFPEDQWFSIHPVPILAVALSVFLLSVCLKKRKNSSSNLQLQGV